MFSGKFHDHNDFVSVNGWTFQHDNFALKNEQTNSTDKQNQSSKPLFDRWRNKTS
jgi:hypothetical protein